MWDTGWKINFHIVVLQIGKIDVSSLITTVSAISTGCHIVLLHPTCHDCSIQSWFLSPSHMDGFTHPHDCPHWLNCLARDALLKKYMRILVNDLIACCLLWGLFSSPGSLYRWIEMKTDHIMNSACLCSLIMAINRWTQLHNNGWLGSLFQMIDKDRIYDVWKYNSKPTTAMSNEQK